ncbi:MAG: PPOX class F420-dependent oxidoreductase [Aggregatilineales bacterium]
MSSPDAQTTQPVTFDVLNGHQFMSLTTFRKTGAAVATPVWFAREGDRLYVMTQSESGKAKRIRNNTPGVTVAPCTSRGKVLGPAARGRARFLEGAEAEHARALLRRKYGLMWQAFNVYYRLSGQGRGVVFLEIVPA